MLDFCSCHLGAAEQAKNTTVTFYHNVHYQHNFSMSNILVYHSAVLCVQMLPC